VPFHDTLLEGATEYGPAGRKEIAGDGRERAGGGIDDMAETVLEPESTHTQSVRNHDHRGDVGVGDRPTCVPFATVCGI